MKEEEQVYLTALAAKAAESPPPECVESGSESHLAQCVVDLPRAVPEGSTVVGILNATAQVTT